MDSPHWEIGKSLRLSRLFDHQSGNSVCVAMDHSFGGAHKGFEDPGKTLEKVLAGQPDGVIITPGTSRKFQFLFRGRNAPAMILSIDYVLFHAFPGEQDVIEEQGMASSVEEAIRLGADAIKILMIFGRKNPSLQSRNFDMVGRVAGTCHRWGMPVIVEPTTWGHRIDSQMAKDPALLRDMARIAFEFGADVVKIDTPENPADFSMVAESCPVPILVLGGAKKPDVESLLRDVDVVVKCGALGVTFGRNVWQHPDPARIIRALKRVVYTGDVAGAIRELNEVMQEKSG